MTRIAGGILLCYGLLLSFGDAFALGPWLPLPLVWLACSVPWFAGGLAVSGPARRSAGLLSGADLALFALLLALDAGVVLSPSLGPKNFNHVLAFTTTSALYYGYVKLLLLVGDDPGRNVARMRTGVSVTLALVSAYACFEFLDVNVLHSGVVEIVRTSAAGEPYRPVFLEWVRARGFEAESGLLALFINLMAPLTLIYVRRRYGRIRSVAFGIVVAAAWTLTFSVGGLAALALGLGFAATVALWDRLTPRRLVVTLVAIGVVVAVAAALPPNVVEPILGKLTLSNVVSGQERAQRWRDAIAAFPEHPLLGVGLGTTSAELGTGVISLYLVLLKEGGLVSLLCFAAFLTLVFRRVLRMRPTHPYKYAYLTGLAAGASQYALFSDFWYPWLWTLCALILADRTEAGAAPPIRAVPEG